jgi:hypothetical protein
MFNLEIYIFLSLCNRGANFYRGRDMAYVGILAQGVPGELNFLAQFVAGYLGASSVELDDIKSFDFVDQKKQALKEC